MIDVSQLTTAAGVPVTNPVYRRRSAEWRLQLDARWGTGGFADGSLVRAHAREHLDHSSDAPQRPTKKLIARREIARHDNTQASIIDTIQTGVFRQPVSRVAHPVYTDWTGHATASGDPLDTALRVGHDLALTTGTAVLVLHERPFAKPPRSLAEQRANLPFLAVYSPLDWADWLEDDAGRLTHVRLLVAKARSTFDVSADLPEIQVLEINAKETVLRTTGGAVIERNAHRFGALPVVLLRGRPAAYGQLHGESVLGSPRVAIDLLNLNSEIRELLRAQTFGILNVELGTGPDAPTTQDAQAMMGSQVGTDVPLFTPGPARYLSPDASNLAAYQVERDTLARMMFRLAEVPYDTDSRDAESEGSRRLKRDSFSQRLAAHAAELQRAEIALAHLLLGWAGVPEAQRELAITWPSNFDPPSVAQRLEEIVAIGMAEGLPISVKREFLRRTVADLLPGLDEPVRRTIEADLAAMEDPRERRERTMSEDMRRRLDGFDEEVA